MNIGSSDHRGQDRLHARHLPDMPKGMPVPREVWERQYQNGEWNYLESDDEAAHYQAIAQFYARHGAGHSVLDIGCGTGVMYRYLAAAGGMPPYRYTGIDLSAAALEQAARREPYADFRQADYSSESLDGKFGCIIFNETLYCFENPLTILDRCARDNMEHNAVLIISMYGDHHDDIWHGIARHHAVLDEAEVENARQVRWKIKVLRPHAVAHDIR